jgi:hypothetical protein
VRRNAGSAGVSGSGGGAAAKQSVRGLVADNWLPARWTT